MNDLLNIQFDYPWVFALIPLVGLLAWLRQRKNKKEGKHIGFWEDGKPKFEFYFTKGEHDGMANEWYSNGQAYKAFHYTMGYENGSQKMWWENGVIRANYAVKQGRRYGLIGLKLCMTPQDSLNYKLN